MSEGERLVSVLMNPHSRAPLHGRFLTPQGWDRAACLHIGSDPHSISLLVESDYVLGLYKICNIAFFIDSSYNKSTTWSSAIFLRNQSEVKLLGIVCHQRLDIEVTKDTRNLERGIRKMVEVFKEIVIENEMGHIAYTVRILVRQVSNHRVRRALRIGIHRL